VVNIEQCNCYFENLQAITKKITVDYGQVTENIASASKQVNVVAQQTYGLICDYAPHIAASTSEG